jgi:phosphate transport system substrate-binding protein
MKPFYSLVAALAALLVTAGMPAGAAGKKITWAGCSISKSAFMAEMVAAYKKKTGIEVELKGGGATKGIRSVANREVGIGGTCRHVIEDSATLTTVTEERRVQLTPVAWDALVVIVHKDNPVDTITLDQLRDVYLGKITNWRDLGGKDAPVEAYARKGKISGVGRTMRELVFADYDQDYVVKHVVEESASLEKDIVSNPNGLGVTGVSSARKISNIAKILKLNGKEPSYDNIRNGEYLLYRPLYMVTHLQQTDPEIKKFIDFVMGPEGKAIMRSVGTVPYEDAIALWLKYLDQQNRAIARMQGQGSTKTARSRTSATP